LDTGKKRRLEAGVSKKVLVPRTETFPEKILKKRGAPSGQQERSPLSGCFSKVKDECHREKNPPPGSPKVQMKFLLGGMPPPTHPNTQKNGGRRVGI